MKNSTVNTHQCKWDDGIIIFENNTRENADLDGRIKIDIKFLENMSPPDGTVHKHIAE